MRIRVLKPFVFSHPPSVDTRVPVEQVFAVGEHEISQEMWEHPWLSVHLADGKIESPVETAARVAKAEALLKKQSEENAIAQREANEAWTRLQAADARRVADATKGDQLNTPANELAGRPAPQGKGPVASPAEIEKELNTPVNEIRAKAQKKE